MSTWAKPGVKCVCISNWGGHEKWYLPKVLQTYTVAFVDAGHPYGPMLELKEITAPRASYKFPVSCFRPLIHKTQEDDVAIFIPLLKTKELVE